MKSPDISDKIQKKVRLASHTTMRVGGDAEYFLDCASIEDIRFALHFAKNHNISLHVLGGGSNTLFPDGGYRGLVIKISLKGMDFQKSKDGVIASIMGGEIFDDFVSSAVSRNLSGVECLSGIPGTAGASPVQNVGAYGQEVSDSIISVDAMEKSTGRMVRFSSEECGFSYRSSKFKKEWNNLYIILGVQFILSEFQKCEIFYGELNEYLNMKYGDNPTVMNIRDSVLHLRKKKSMVIDPSDPDSVSCGSFFINPYVTDKDIVNIKKSLKESGESVDSLPIFNVSDRYKTSAAFLIERAGFKKGYEKNGAGISSKHALALVNRGCGRSEILALADEIISGVHRVFGITLVMEPVIVGDA